MFDTRLVLTFYYQFENQDEVEFAFSYPYSYTKNLEFIQSLEDNYKDDKEIYFHKEIITYSPFLRPIHLLTISSYDQILETTEDYINDNLFPEKEYETRALRFSEKKPVILFSARVHPGESPASYALEGIINFLLDKRDARAYLLRKLFCFMIVPMLNPDGVYNGHYRMDTFN